jgi:hypothetical protein
MDLSANVEKAPLAQSKSVRGSRARTRGRGKKRAHGQNRGKFVSKQAVEPEVQPIFSAEEETGMNELQEEAMKATKASRETLNRTLSWLSNRAGDQEEKVLMLFKPTLQALTNSGSVEDPHLQQHRNRATLECLREVGALCLPLGSASETLNLIELVKKAAANKQPEIKRLASEILERWRVNLKDVCLTLVDPNLSLDPTMTVLGVFRDKEMERRGIVGGAGAEAAVNFEIQPLPSHNQDVELEGGEGDIGEDDEGEEDSDASD